MVALQADGRTPPCTGAGWEREHGRATAARRPWLSSMVDIDQSRASSKEFRLGGGGKHEMGHWLAVANWQFAIWRSEKRKTLAFPCNSSLPVTHIKPKCSFEGKVIWSRKCPFSSVGWSQSNLEKMTTFSCLHWHCNLFQTFSSLEIRSRSANNVNVKWALRTMKWQIENFLAACLVLHKLSRQRDHMHLRWTQSRAKHMVQFRLQFRFGQPIYQIHMV